MSWYRLTTNASGKVLSCVAVEAEGPDEARVFYVTADSEEVARELGRLAWNRYMLPRMRARRAELKKKGACSKCARPNDRLPKDRCTKCVAREQVYSERRRKRERGEPVEPLDKKVALQERAVEESQSLRLAVLEEVRDAWLHYPTVGQFTEWLRRKIEAAGGKRERDVA